MAAADFGDHQSEYGDVEYADPKNHKYPINNETRVRAAWSYINMPKNQGGYTPGEVASIKAKIKAAGKKYGIKFEGDGDGNGNRSVGLDGLEERSTLVKIERRSASPNSREIGGYAAVFNKESHQMMGERGRFKEIVANSAFNKSRADGWPGAGGGVVCRYNHDNFHLLGSTRSGTLRLMTDPIGLDYVVDVPETRQDVLELVTRGDLPGSSIAMMVTQDDWNHDNGYVQRMLVEVKLVDVSPVITPAYPDSTVAVRSLATFVGATEADVLDRADRQELRGFFERTDIDGGAPRKRTLAQAKLAKMEMLGRRPVDPIDPQRRDVV